MVVEEVVSGLRIETILVCRGGSNMGQVGAIAPTEILKKNKNYYNGTIVSLLEGQKKK